MIHAEKFTSCEIAPGGLATIYAVTGCAVSWGRSEFSFAGHAYLFCMLLHCRCSKRSHTYNVPDHMQ